MNDIQRLFNAMSDAARGQRSNYHLTLGGLIKALEAADPRTVVAFDNEGHPSSANSYRGYYADLAFAVKQTETTADDLLRQAKLALGDTFEGYKGGDFTMGDDTPLWMASWGHTGLAIVGISEIDGRLVLATKQLD